MYKKLRIRIYNLIIIVILVLFIEFIIWAIGNHSLKTLGAFDDEIKYIKFHTGIKHYEDKIAKLAKKEGNWGRKPEGLMYKSSPIVIFGCSYAYGFKLNNEQTFAHKLASIAKKTVYNQAYVGLGIQHMLFQSSHESLYEYIKNPEYVIFLFIHDHYRRLFLLSFGTWNILNEEFTIRYKEKGGNLIKDTNNNFLKNQYRRLYLFNTMQNSIASKYAKNIKNKKEVQNFALKHFIESKNNMQKYWKDTKYVVIFYNFDEDETYIKQELRNAGYNIIDTRDLTNENLNAPKYMQPNFHPKEEAWNLLAPKIFEQLILIK